MADVARLQIKIDSLSAEIAALRLDKVTGASRKTQSATAGLTKVFAGATVVTAAFAAAVKALSVVADVSKRFQDMEARLVTATGSMEGAAIAMEAIKDLAVETPYDIEQVTNGFIRLANLGLSPSERALRSYGNTASATGKSLNQLVEAVADAATFEFERLKEFGIKANQMGDRVSFTFRGVTTTVEKSSKAVTDYLTALGENEFAGEMERRMETLGGAVSNMQDQFIMAVDNIGKAGLADLMEDGFRRATDALELFNASMESGEMGARLELEASRWNFLAEEANAAMDWMTQMWNEVPQEWKEAGADALQFIIDMWTYLPENIAYVHKRIIIEFQYLVDVIQRYTSNIGERWENTFDHIVARSKVYAVAIGEALDPFSDGFDMEGALKRVDDFFEGEAKRLAVSYDDLNAARSTALEGIKTERAVAIDSYEAQSAAVKRLREQYLKDREARRATAGDRLAQFGQDESSGPTLAQQREAEKQAKIREKEFERLQEYLRTEEETILHSYNNRMRIILENTQAGSDARSNLQKQLNEKFREEVLDEDIRNDDYDRRIEKLVEYYERRRNLILENTQLTEEQRTELELELTKQRNDQIAALEMEKNQFISQTAMSMSNDLLTIAKGFAGEQSGIYRVMFAASKAFAIADSIMKIQQGIANAASLPWPANLGAIASTVAATANIVSTIQSVQMQGGSYAGAYDKGGHIPAGQFGIVGEHGMEFVKGPANVTGREDTRKLLERAARGGDSGQGGAQQALQSPTNIRIINSVDPALMTEYMGSAEGEKVIMNVVRRNGRTIKQMVA
ncbi:tail length tape-measure protein [Vibrio phage vB_VpaS_AL-2]|nr:tail length tape-measure protein [Vibrio phage vB_VpaS_AL-2]